MKNDGTTVCPKDTKQKSCYQEAERCLQCYDAPCTHGCPAGIDVAKFIRFLSKGDILGAAKVIKRDNPLGLICGYICPYESFCQKGCTSHKLGRPIDIRSMQQFVIEEAMNTTSHNPILQNKTLSTQRINNLNQVTEVDYSPTLTPAKIGIIGGGPAGISCAYYLNSLGHNVEIFEQNQELGGYVSSGIPDFRLDRAKTEMEIAALCHGIKIHYGKKLGRDINLKDLKNQGYDGIFISTGLWKEKKLVMPGADLAYTAQDILLPNRWQKTNEKTAAIIGAGNVAMDVAQTLIKSGVETHILFIGTPKEMEAWQGEREEAWQAGTIFHLISMPKEIKIEQGHVCGVLCHRSKVSTNEQGWRAEALADLDFLLPVDMVVFAVGQTTEADILSNEGLELSKIGHILVNDSYQTNLQGVFAGGDTIGNGRGTVVQAVADGKKAAFKIFEYLSEEGK